MMTFLCYVSLSVLRFEGGGIVVNPYTLFKNAHVLEYQLKPFITSKINKKSPCTGATGAWGLMMGDHQMR